VPHFVTLSAVVPRLVTFPGTHNSNALKTSFASLAEHQKLTFAEQLQVRQQRC
jgi:hypothetical protein